MSDRFASLQLFVRVARIGSFSLAGRELGLSQPSASRIVAALEQQVGVALLSRSTRGARLTDAGAEYLVRAEAILAALDEADHAARGTGELHGIMRIACSATFALRSILPQLASFTGPAGRSAEGWTFHKAGRTLSPHVEGRYVLDATEAATVAAVQGLGIVSTADLACRQELEQGTLVRVLPDWHMGAADVFLVFPAGRRAKPSARAFADFIGAAFRTSAGTADNMSLSQGNAR